jgi:hypothetical protein
MLLDDMMLSGARSKDGDWTHVQVTSQNETRNRDTRSVSDTAKVSSDAVNQYLRHYLGVADAIVSAGPGNAPTALLYFLRHRHCSFNTSHPDLHKSNESIRESGGFVPAVTGSSFQGEPVEPSRSRGSGPHRS